MATRPARRASVRRDHRLRPAAVARHAEDGVSHKRREENRSVPAPCAERRNGSDVAQRHGRPVRKIDPFELAGREETQGPPVRRPEDRIAPSVPGTTRASRPDIGRSQITGGCAARATNASWDPSGKRRGTCPHRVVERVAWRRQHRKTAADALAGGSRRRPSRNPTPSPSNAITAMAAATAVPRRHGSDNPVCSDRLGFSSAVSSTLASPISRSRRVASFSRHRLSSRNRYGGVAAGSAPQSGSGSGPRRSCRTWWRAQMRRGLSAPHRGHSRTPRCRSACRPLARVPAPGSCMPAVPTIRPSRGAVSG